MNRVVLTFALLWATSAHAAEWWPLDPGTTLVIDTTKGRIVVEMRPDLAPMAVARIKQLAHEHIYDGLLFHRVLDHYVDQTGNPNNRDGGTSTYPNLKPEFRAVVAQSSIDAIATQSSDGITGFVGATPVAASINPQRPATWRAWGLYCPGVAGMGREEGLDTANSEIFFMRDANRSLDHDYTVWGRVVDGLDVVRAIAVGEPPAHPDRMIRVRIMADMPEPERPHFEVIDTHSATFAATVANMRKVRGADFSVCDVPIARQEK